MKSAGHVARTNHFCITQKLVDNLKMKFKTGNTEVMQWTKLAEDEF
jgi:hypothetical protein